MPLWSIKCFSRERSFCYHFWSFFVFLWERSKYNPKKFFPLQLSIFIAASYFHSIFRLFWLPIAPRSASSAGHSLAKNFKLEIWNNFVFQQSVRAANPVALSPKFEFARDSLALVLLRLGRWLPSTLIRSRTEPVLLWVLGVSGIVVPADTWPGQIKARSDHNRRRFLAGLLQQMKLRKG